MQFTQFINPSLPSNDSIIIDLSLFFSSWIGPDLLGDWKSSVFVYLCLYWDDWPWFLGRRWTNCGYKRSNTRWANQVSLYQKRGGILCLSLPSNYIHDDSDLESHIVLVTAGCVEAGDKTGAVGSQGGKLLGKTLHQGCLLLSVK